MTSFSEILHHPKVAKARDHREEVGNRGITIWLKEPFAFVDSIENNEMFGRVPVIERVMDALSRAKPIEDTQKIGYKSICTTFYEIRRTTMMKEPTNEDSKIQSISTKTTRGLLGYNELIVVNGVYTTIHVYFEDVEGKERDRKLFEKIIEHWNKTYGHVVP